MIKSLYKFFLAALALFCLLIFILAQFKFSISGFLGPDEANFYYQGFALSKELKPFLDFVDNKNPGIFYLVSPIAKIWPWNLTPVIALFSLIHLANIFLLIKIAKNFTKSNRVWFIGSIVIFTSYLAFSTFTFDSHVMPQTPALFCIILGYLYYFNNKPHITGLLFGVAFLFLQTTISNLLIIFIYEFIIWLNKNKGERSLVPFGKLFIGFVIPPALMVIIASFQGWLGPWIKYAYIYNSNYADSLIGILYRIPRILLLPVVLPGLFLFVLFLLSLILCRLLEILGKARPSQPVDKIWILAFVMVVASLIQLASTKYIAVHHYYQIWPAFALLAVLSLNKLEIFFKSDKFAAILWTLISAGSLIYLLIISLLISSFIYTNHTNKKNAASGPSEQEKTIAEIIKRSGSDDTILIWDFNDLIYLKSERLAASRFHHMLQLTSLDGSFPTNQEDRRLFVEDMKRNKPKLIMIGTRRVLFGPAYSKIEEYYPDFNKEYRLVFSPSGKHQLFERINP